MLEIVSEIESMIGFEHCYPHHHLDVWEHTLYVLSFSTSNFDVRLALLFYDIGNPSWFQSDNGVRHFKGHAEKSAHFADIILKRLKYDDEYENLICNIIIRHDVPLAKDDIASNFDLSKTIFEVQNVMQWHIIPKRIKRD